MILYKAMINLGDISLPLIMEVLGHAVGWKEP